ncbi:MAG: hypothetical protein R3B95_07950 [Nitrospirales bacterium]|nr:hypothetical protein [Nitrospirales bacterium]
MVISSNSASATLLYLTQDIAMLPTSITASMLYTLIGCEHRVLQDTFGDPSQADEPNAFIQLLWEKGHSLNAS